MASRCRGCITCRVVYIIQADCDFWWGRGGGRGGVGGGGLCPCLRVMMFMVRRRGRGGVCGGGGVGRAGGGRLELYASEVLYLRVECRCPIL